MNRQKAIIVNSNPVVINYYLNIAFERSETDRYRRLVRLKEDGKTTDDEESELVSLANKSVTPVPTIKNVTMYDTYYVDLNNIPKTFGMSYDDMKSIMKACQSLEDEVKELKITLKEYVSQPDDLPF